MAATCQGAAVYQTDGGSVAGKHAQADVVAFGFQLCAQLGITGNDCFFLFVSFDPAFLSHNCVGEMFTLYGGYCQAEFCNSGF